MWSKFPDDKTWLQHDRKGLLSMANSGKNTNSSQFFITTKKCNYLDGKHIVFGEVVSGFETVDKIEKVKVEDKAGRPIDEERVVIVGCGEVDIKNEKNKTVPAVAAANKAPSPFGGFAKAASSVASPKTTTTTAAGGFSFGQTGNTTVETFLSQKKRNKSSFRMSEKNGGYFWWWESTAEQMDLVDWLHLKLLDLVVVELRNQLLRDLGLRLLLFQSNLLNQRLYLNQDIRCRLGWHQSLFLL